MQKLKDSTAPAKMESETLIDLLMSDSTDYAIVNLDSSSSSSCSSLQVAATVRCGLKSKEDISRWMSQLERRTNTKFVVERNGDETNGMKCVKTGASY